MDVTDRKGDNLVVKTAAATRDIANVLEEKLRLPLSRGKTVVAASSRSVATKLEAALVQLGATAQEAPTRLGLQFALRPHSGRELQN